MAEVVVAATDKLIQRQAQLWQASIDAAAARWAGMAETAGASLTRALEESLSLHAQRLAASEDTIAEQSRQQWQKIAETECSTCRILPPCRRRWSNRPSRWSGRCRRRTRWRSSKTP